jgi:hypothetical protein
MSILITGNTYPVKDQLKALGGKWDPASKGWLVPDDKAEIARVLVGKPEPKAAPAAFHNHPHAPRRTCTCTGDCCRPRCRCESHCNCRGGNIYDC